MRESIVTLAPQTIHGLSAADLAELAGVGRPERPDSAGARFLLGVRDDLSDWIENSGEPLDATAVEALANDAVPTATSVTWATFYDLAAWQVDVTDLTGDRISASRLTEHAESVLSFVAEALLKALLARIEAAA